MPELQRTIVRGPVPADVGGTATAPVSDPWLEDQLGFAWYLRAAQRRWWLLACGLALGAVAGVVVAMRQPVLYEASAALLASPAPGAPPNSPVSAATFAAVVQNGALVAEVVRELNLEKPPNGLTPQGFLERALVVDAAPGTNVLNVRVRLGDPGLAADAARRLAMKSIALNRQLGEAQGSAVEKDVKAHLDEAASRAETAEQALLTYQQRAQIDLVEEDSRALLEARHDLLQLVVDIESERARLAAAEQQLSKESPVLSIPRDVNAEAALRQPAGDVTAESLNLRNPFVNPVYQTLQLQMATSRARLAALEQQRHQLVDVKGVGAADVAKLAALYKGRIELARLQSAADLSRRIYSDLAVQYEEQRATASRSSPQLQLLDAGAAPDQPLSRHVARSATLGGVIGFGMVSLVVLLRSSAERRGPSRPPRP